MGSGNGADTETKTGAQPAAEFERGLREALAHEAWVRRLEGNPFGTYALEQVRCGLYGARPGPSARRPAELVPEDGLSFPVFAGSDGAALIEKARLDDGIAETIFREFPGVDAAFLAKHGVAIAGGAVAGALRRPAATGGDLDLFVVDPGAAEMFGDPPADGSWVASRAVPRVWGVVDALRERLPNAREYRTQSCVTFVDGEIVYQVVLRLFSSVADLLADFDIGPAKVALAAGPGGNPPRLHFSPVAAFSYGWGAFPIEPAMDGPTYAQRIAKYWRRGWAVAAPEMALDAQSGTAVLGGMRKMRGGAAGGYDASGCHAAGGYDASGAGGDASRLVIRWCAESASGRPWHDQPIPAELYAGNRDGVRGCDRGFDYLDRASIVCHNARVIVAANEHNHNRGDFRQIWCKIRGMIVADPEGRPLLNLDAAGCGSAIECDPRNLDVVWLLDLLGPRRFPDVISAIARSPRDATERVRRAVAEARTALVDRARVVNAKHGMRACCLSRSVGRGRNGECAGDAAAWYRGFAKAAPETDPEADPEADETADTECDELARALRGED